MMKNAVIALLVAALALSVAGVVAQTQRTATVEVRIWEDIEDPTQHLVSHRPQGGEWSASQPLPALYDGFVQAGRYRYRDAFVNATVPQPLPPTIEFFDLTCEEHNHPGPRHFVLRGSFRNGTNATLSEVVITAALVNEDGVEVIQATDEIPGGIAPDGERTFLVNFFQAPGVAGTCPIVSVAYAAAVRYEAPIP